ncbi:MAG: site-specific integrase [Caulobacteraceae bacterium]|nr:site-specific integrase [Caulobacteraceae bacterium]
MPGNEIVTIPPARDLAPAAAGAEVDRLAAAAAAYADAASAASTRRAYDSSWRAFETWCAAHQAVALPAHPGTVLLFLTDHAGRLSVASLARHLAAIRSKHRLADLPAPGGPELERVWSGIRREHGRAPRKKFALVTADLRRVVQRLPEDLGGQRDRALLLVGFAGALRRSELAPLELDDGKSLCGPSRIRFVPGGLEIRLDRSKTDQEGAGHVVAIPHGKTKLCPVRALRAWLEAAAIAAGPVFRAVDRHGRVAAAAISDRAVADIVKRACERAGLDPEVFSGHSLRAGLVTSAANAGLDVELIMRQTRHTKADTVLGYIRDADRFKRNAAGKVGL